MTVLKKLVVGRYSRTVTRNGFRVTDHIVEYGIAEIPSLSVLQLNWVMTIELFHAPYPHIRAIVRKTFLHFFAEFRSYGSNLCEILRTFRADHNQQRR